MNRIVIALFVLALVQLVNSEVNSQTPCFNAVQTFYNDTICSFAVAYDTACIGTCRNLFDNIIAECQGVNEVS